MPAKYIIAFLWLAGSVPGATLLRIDCGGPGGLDAQGNVWTADAFSSGGARWTAANQPAMAGMPVPYQALRYSAAPGAPVSYAIPVTPGAYSVTLKFLEPNKTGAGQRIFSVTLNGSVVVAGLDLFAVAGGALKPYDATFPVQAPGGQIVISLAPALGNAVVSGIQVDSVDAPASGILITTGAVDPAGTCTAPTAGVALYYQTADKSLWVCLGGHWEIVLTASGVGPFTILGDLTIRDKLILPGAVGAGSAVACIDAQGTVTRSRDGVRCP